MPKDLRFVLAAGAGGGLLSWAFTIVTENATFGLSIWEALPLCVILGMGAAVVAVYVITPTDTSKTAQLIGYAVLCGFLWKPVLDAGRVLVNQHIEAAQRSATLATHVDAIKTALTPAAAVAKANDAADGAVELIHTATRVDNPALQQRVTTQATAAVNAIAETSTADAPAATISLDKVKKAAELSGNIEVANFAEGKLATIRRMNPGLTKIPPPRQP